MHYLAVQNHNDLIANESGFRLGPDVAIKVDDEGI